MGSRWSGSFPLIAAVAVVGALTLLTVTVMDGDEGPETATADLDADVGTRRARPPTTTPTTRSTSTTVTPPPTTAPPAVLGDVTQRGAGTGPAPSSAPAVTAAPTPTTTTTAAPTTTTATCRGSVDPACGPLVWDPEPGPYEVEVYAVDVPIEAVVGEPVTLAVEYVEPAGVAAIGACTFWTVDDPGVVNTSSCEEVAHACDRYGPHDPPAPSRDRVPVRRQVTFTTPGEHTISVSGHTATHLPDGCGNPYLNSLERSYTVIVRERA